MIIVCETCNHYYIHPAIEMVISYTFCLDNKLDVRRQQMSVLQMSISICHSVMSFPMLSC